MKRYFAIIILLFVACFTTAQKNFFLWAQPDGTPVVIFSDGHVKPVFTIWAGYAAWNNPQQVAQEIKNKIAQGYVPYVFSYQFGDNGIKNNLSKAIDFDRSIATAIGAHFAFVNIETEWDVLMQLMSSAEGKRVLKKRISTFRTNAPQAILFSSPGLWKPQQQYQWFREFDDLLDLRSDLQHVVNKDSGCTRRFDGSHFEGGYYLDEGKKTAFKILEKQMLMSDIWGESGKKTITADLAITSCGWNAQGQAAVVKNLVANFSMLYSRGWRGALIRNYAPDNVRERYMGVENEGGFVFSYHATVAKEIQNGLNVAKQMLQKDPGNPDPLPSFKITVDSSSNEWWLQLKITPNEFAKKVQLYYEGQWVSLTKENWGDWTLRDHHIDVGKKYTVRITNIEGKSVKKDIHW